MKFDDLDAKMRQYETVHDICISPDIHMVARLDGRGFTKLTKEVMDFKRPFDERFRDTMLATTAYLMTDAGFHFVYGYTQSDEISLLFEADEASFGRKLRKLNSVLAGEASAKFSLLLGTLGALDCRISELPTVDLVADYFRWRQEDAHRNSLNAHCYWLLRSQGHTVRQATNQLEGMAISEKQALLAQNGIVFDALPNWQKWGSGMYWETYEKAAQNPKTGEAVTAIRKRLETQLDLPIGAHYGRFVTALLSKDAR